MRSVAEATAATGRKRAMPAQLPKNWTETDQDDLDRGKSSYDDGEWSRESEPSFGDRLATGFEQLGDF